MGKLAKDIKHISIIADENRHKLIFLEEEKKID